MFISNHRIRSTAILRSSVLSFLQSIGYKDVKEISGISKDRKVFDTNLKLNGRVLNVLIDYNYWLTGISNLSIKKHKEQLVTDGVSNVFVITRKEVDIPIDNSVSDPVIVLDYEQFQALIGEHWVNFQFQKLEKKIAKVRDIFHSHFSTYDPVLTIIRNSYFYKSEYIEQFEKFRITFQNLMIQCEEQNPVKYLDSVNSVDFSQLDDVMPKRITYHSAAEYFQLLNKALDENIESFELFFNTAKIEFKNLPESTQTIILAERQTRVHEELPIKTLKKYLSVGEYSKIKELLKSK